MGKTCSIYGLTDETKLKLKLLALAKGEKIGVFVSGLINAEWNRDRMPVSRGAKRKIKKLLKKYEGSL